MSETRDWGETDPGQMLLCSVTLMRANIVATVGFLSCAACGSGSESSTGTGTTQGSEAGTSPTQASGSDTGDRTVEQIELTWLGVTTWLVQYGETTVLFDAFFSRPGTSGPLSEGLDRLSSILNAAGVDGVDYILVGHSHFDHAVDCGAAALETGARVVGSSTTCLIAQAQGLPADRCVAVDHGQELELGEAQVTAVRTVHWSPRGFGLHGVLTELPATPAEQATAPHGGVISFLLTAPSAEGELSLFYQNTLGPLDGDDDSGRDFAADLDAVFGPRSGIDLWLGAGNFAETREELDSYLQRIRPAYVLPQHWDGLTPDVEAGLTAEFEPPDFWADALEGTQTQSVVPTEYFERFVLTDQGFAAGQSPVRVAFGL